jgi:phage terminase large subunit-like protein
VTVESPFALDWFETQGRPSQIEPPGDWRTWLILAGRGWGKTRTGAEWVRWQIAHGATRVALVAPTAADARDVMVEGESGLLAVCSRDAVRPVYHPGLRRILFPEGSAIAPHGAMCTTYSAEEPDRLRGPQHDAAWCDELAAWKYPFAWDMLMMGLRLGQNPRVCVTTTPRPTPVIRELVDSANTYVTRGSTFENEANLSPIFMERILNKYDGTRLGRQELYAEILLDVPGALWTREMLETAVGLWPEDNPQLDRIVVAIDPAVTSGENSDETGIVVAGRDRDRGYVMADRTCRLSPDGWARRAIDAYHEFDADRIVAEANQGGDMVKLTLRTVDPSVPVKLVHASRGKRVRAEPIAALYEQGKIAHREVFSKLEDQLVTWTPDSPTSPDRLDALVWALTDLDLARPVGARAIKGPRF